MPKKPWALCWAFGFGRSFVIRYSTFVIPFVRVNSCDLRADDVRFPRGLNEMRLSAKNGIRGKMAGVKILQTVDC
jgi:hypothetical protein